MLSLPSRRTLALLDIMFASADALEVGMDSLEAWSSKTLWSLSDALERRWMTERETDDGVVYTLTKLGRREVDAYQRLLRGEASGL